MNVIIQFVIVLALMSPINSRAQPLKVICDEWAPYQIVKNNDVTGFSTEIVKAVFSKMDIDIDVIQAYPWKRAITMLEAGQVDALFSANYDKTRTEFATYPEEPLIITPWVMWVHQDNMYRFRSFSDLQGKRVGMVHGYSYTHELWNAVKQFGSYEVVYSDEQNFKKLNARRVDIIPAELGNGLYLKYYLGLNNVVPILEKPIKTDGLYIIFNKNTIGNTLVEQFSDELAKLKQEPLYKELHNKYFKLPSR